MAVSLPWGLNDVTTEQHTREAESLSKRRTLAGPWADLTERIPWRSVVDAESRGRDAVPFLHSVGWMFENSGVN